MNDKPRNEIDIFIAAAKIPLQARAEFLANACAGNEALRRKLEALLKAHDRLGDFLEEPPSEETYNRQIP